MKKHNKTKRTKSTQPELKPAKKILTPQEILEREELKKKFWRECSQRAAAALAPDF